MKRFETNLYSRKITILRWKSSPRGIISDVEDQQKKKKKTNSCRFFNSRIFREDKQSYFRERIFVGRIVPREIRRRGKNPHEANVRVGLIPSLKYFMVLPIIDGDTRWFHILR